jgi:hypothetical protein
MAENADILARIGCRPLQPQRFASRPKSNVRESSPQQRRPAIMTRHVSDDPPI